MRIQHVTWFGHDEVERVWIIVTGQRMFKLSSDIFTVEIVAKDVIQITAEVGDRD